VITLGDLNADCSYLRASDDISLRDSDYIWGVDDGFDTTVSSPGCAYDRFIFKSPTAEDLTCKWRIYRNVLDDISDHYLV